MKIAIGCDKLGYVLKERIKQHLQECGHEVVDFGTDDGSSDPRSYVEIASTVAKAIQSKECDRGILMCNTGMGVTLVANKLKGVYCALCESTWTAQRCRQINNANILSMGAGVVGEKVALSMVDVFLETDFAHGEPPERKQLLTGFLNEFAEFENSVFSA